ncbi:MAG: DUF1570 domain-containing protein [Planctomycetota bacterium]
MGRHIVDDRRLVRPVGPIAVSLFAVATLLWAAVASSAAEPAFVTVRFRDAFSGFAPREVDGEVVWETERVLEVRDSAGAIAVLPRENVDEIRPLDGPVGPITVEEFAARLKTSFPRNTPVRTGDGFVVVGTGGPRFLGQCLTNAGRLRREFAEIWDGPRTTVSEPPYPLAVVTFATDAEMQRFVKAETGHVSSGGRAFFAATTNRVYVRAPRTAAEWPRVTNDVLHELTHQQSFNRGLQTRLSDYPLWISEGVAMLTEAADRRGRPPRAGRLPMNPARIAELVRADPKDFEFDRLITAGPATRTSLSAGGGYAFAWALTRFFYDRRRDDLDRYLAALREKPRGELRSAEVYRADFEAAFGDVGPVEAEFRVYLNEITGRR